MTADDCSQFSMKSCTLFLLTSPFVRDCVKAVALNPTAVEVKPRETPGMHADATESPPGPPQDQKRPIEVSGTAAHQDPDVSGVLYYRITVH